MEEPTPAHRASTRLIAAEPQLLAVLHRRWYQQPVKPPKWRELRAAAGRLHLSALRLSLLSESPELFVSYFSWLTGSLLKQGVSYADATASLEDLETVLSRALADDEVRAVRPYLRQALAASAPSTEQAPRSFVAALVGGDLAAARATTHGALVHGHAYVYERLLQPAMQLVGELWARGDIDVADEHRATTTARRVVASLYPTCPWPIRGPKAVLACVEGERHDFGLQLLADLLALSGWNTVSYGADTPLEDLAGKVRDERPVFVGLSAARRALLPKLEETVKVLHRSLPGTPLLVGGQLLEEAREEVMRLDRVTPVRRASEAVSVVEPWRRRAEGQHA